LVRGIVVSLQHAEQPIGIHGSERPIFPPVHPTYSKRVGCWNEIRAVRVAWIS
jgi:hypothetical protein